MVRDFAEKELKPRAAEIDATRTYPLPVLKAMTDLEFMGRNIPAEYGGSQTGLVSCRPTSPSLKLLEVSPRKMVAKRKIWLS
jgi:alkylation response protein AidB-like acyl-CoA dehydrogenase